VITGLAHLRDRSLIFADEAEGEVRFHMLDTLREFGEEQLEPASAAELRRRHAAFFADLAEQAEPELVGPQQAEWMRRLRLDHDNFHAALAWSQSPGGEIEYGLRIVAGLGRYFEVREQGDVVELWLGKLIQRGASADPALRARALESAGNFVSNRQSEEWALGALEESLELYRGLGDAFGEARLLCSVSVVYRELNQRERARRLLEEALPVLRRSGDAYEIARALGAQAILASFEDDLPAARSLLEQSAAMYRVCGHRRRVAWCLFQLARLCRLREEYGEERALLQDALRFFQETADLRWVAFCIRDLAEIGELEGDVDEIRRRCEAGVEVCRRIGEARFAATFLLWLGDLAAVQGEPVRAAALYREALVECRRAGKEQGVRAAFVQLAALAALHDEPERAAGLYGAADSIPKLFEREQPRFRRFVLHADPASVRSALGDAGYEAAERRGRSFPFAEQVEIALEAMSFER
jgi:tetratricopeptide (TPR) repeat protein